MKFLSLVALALASVAFASPEPEAAAAETIQERTYLLTPKGRTMAGGPCSACLTLTFRTHAESSVLLDRYRSKLLPDLSRS
jgi:hypothetical protein